MRNIRNCKISSFFLGFFTLGLLALAGCSANPLAGMHQDGVESNSNVLTADGNAALARGDYDRAVRYFQLAIEHDPTNSEARMGWAQAELKRRQFDVVQFYQTLSTSSQGGSTTPSTLIAPADWGCADTPALITLFDTFIGVLDPIALGLTQGPVARNQVTLNLDLGLFYVLRMASRAQNLSTTIQVLKYTKGTPEALALGIPSAVYDLLPQEFYWVSNATTGQLLLVQADIDAGIARLETAAANSSAGSNAQKQLRDLIDLFKSLQTQVHL